MLAHQIRGVFAMPIVVAGEYVGALDLFRAQPGRLDAINSPALSPPPSSQASRCSTFWTPTCRPPSTTPTAMPGQNSTR